MKQFPRSIVVLALDELHSASGIAAALLEQGVDGEDPRVRKQFGRMQQAVVVINTGAMCANTAGPLKEEKGLRKL